MYEVNLGRIEASWYWHCSWAVRFFSVTSPAEKQESLAKVLDLRESAFYKLGLDEREKHRRDQVLDDASAGNVEKLEQIITINCPVDHE
ncbi:hypothetical protein ACIBJE_19555 [Micromonospora sp. NPDC050187]|uniref:hypothetical protein n=1 Tax=Micromonospora sp. NPDC050187 TaxID=3364277 RepID=UPI0037A71534